MLGCVQVKQLSLPELQTAEDAADFCSIVRDDLQAQAGTFASMALVRARLSKRPGLRSSTASAATRFEWHEGCELALRAHVATSQGFAVASTGGDAFLRTTADGSAQICMRSVRSFVRSARGVHGVDAPAEDSPPELAGAQQRRRLRARAGGGKAGSNAAKGRNHAVTSGEGSVAGKGWNTSDVSIASARIWGRAMPVRQVGAGNALAGGMLLHQVCCAACACP